MLRLSQAAFFAFICQLIDRKCGGEWGGIPCNKVLSRYQTKGIIVVHNAITPHDYAVFLVINSVFSKLTLKMVASKLSSSQAW